MKKNLFYAAFATIMNLSYFGQCPDLAIDNSNMGFTLLNNDTLRSSFYFKNYGPQSINSDYTISMAIRNTSTQTYYPVRDVSAQAIGIFFPQYAGDGYNIKLKCHLPDSVNIPNGNYKVIVSVDDFKVIGDCDYSNNSYILFGSFNYYGNAATKIDESKNYNKVFKSWVYDDNLYLDVAKNEAIEYAIYSSTGVLVKEILAETGMNKIDISELASGVYLIKSKKSSAYKKFIIE